MTSPPTRTSRPAPSRIPVPRASLSHRNNCATCLASNQVGTRSPLSSSSKGAHPHPLQSHPNDVGDTSLPPQPSKSPPPPPVSSDLRSESNPCYVESQRAATPTDHSLSTEDLSAADTIPLTSSGALPATTTNPTPPSSPSRPPRPISPRDRPFPLNKSNPGSRVDETSSAQVINPFIKPASTEPLPEGFGPTLRVSEAADRVILGHDGSGGGAPSPWRYWQAISDRRPPLPERPPPAPACPPIPVPAALAKPSIPPISRLFRRNKNKSEPASASRSKSKSEQETSVTSISTLQALATQAEIHAKKAEREAVMARQAAEEVKAVLNKIDSRNHDS